MVSVNWGPLIEALDKNEEVVSSISLHLVEPTTEDEEYDIKQSFDRRSRPFLNKRMRKQMTFREWLKEAKAKPKPHNLIPHP